MHTNVLCELEILDSDFLNKSHARYAGSLGTAAKLAQDRLTVVLSNPTFSVKPSSRPPYFDALQALLAFTYSCCITAAHSTTPDVVVLLKGWSRDQRALGIHWDCILGNDSGPHICSPEKYEDRPVLSHITSGNGNISTTPTYPHETHNVVSVNGTFDHLHVGHKSLITASAWLAGEKLICAISHDQAALVARKSVALGLEDYDTRFKAAHAFLRLIVPCDLDTVVVPVSAPYGQSTVDGSVSAVVLSAESIHHSRRIQEIRSVAQLPPVQFFCVDLVTGNVPPSRIHDNSWVKKISSSHTRRTQLPVKTFVLINGFVGVGKSTVARHLASLLPLARVIDNHLLLDPADALCPRSCSGYQELRQQFRSVAFRFIIDSESSSFLFTSNCSVSELGTATARQYQQAAKECGAKFVPVVLDCDLHQVRNRVADPARVKSSRFKLQDPEVASKIWQSKEIFRFHTSDELYLDTSHSTAEEVARSIFYHIRNLTTNQEE
ncbi:hypothetical protein C8R43DRAFT_345603 [Mycena crocata]|nr:hypothetical protein C8R43DRAFT_345603 [Mycena crocata]